MKVLVITSRAELQHRLEQTFRADHFALDAAPPPAEPNAGGDWSTYSGVLLDADSIGFEPVLGLIAHLRHRQPSTTIVCIEGNLDLQQRLALFEAGADECMHEPFYALELCVRLSLLIRLRQSAAQVGSYLQVGELEMDLVRRRVTRAGTTIDLRPKEFLLLEYLLRNADRPVTRAMILEHVWNSPFDGSTNLVDVYISALRNKIDKGFSQKLIQTARGVGYVVPRPTQAAAATMETNEQAHCPAQADCPAASRA